MDPPSLLSSLLPYATALLKAYRFLLRLNRELCQKHSNMLNQLSLHGLPDSPPTLFLKIHPFHSSIHPERTSPELLQLSPFSQLFLDDINVLICPEAFSW